MQAPRLRPFRLTRFFSLTSLVGILVVTACLIATYRELTLRHLVAHESRANADLTRAFANTVWRDYRDFVVNSRGRSRADLLADPAMARLRADVLGKMAGMQVAKVKIYNLDGLTVFSSDERQVGEDKSANRGFIEARAGRVIGELTHREKFDAFDGVISNRNLIFTYIPVQAAGGAAPEGVFEVYSDVTDLIKAQSRAQWQVAGIVLALLGLLYAFLFFIVRKADRVIARQEQERADQEQEVRHQAYHDGLTGLPNRTYFGERLAETLALAARHGQTCALMFIDLDRFKIVNDSLGHDAGDTLLKEVSKRIAACLRAGDLLFRMGGDEFTIILPQEAKPEDAAHVAKRVLEAVAAPVPIHEHEVTVGASIGIAVYPGDGDTADALLKNADAAMYSAKEGGRNRHAFYRAEMNRRALQRLDLESALKNGFRNGEFTLYYQPRLNAATRRVVALEALLRWNSPARGVVPPADFISVLEESGMMTMVGEWVLRSACNQIARWQQEGCAPLRVSVNISALQFEGAGFVPMVKRVFAASGVAPALIELELTESLLIRNPERARATIAELKALGVCISIDDFGTGYSSLSYLRDFAVDYLKIDRSFVTHIATEARDRAVVVAIIEMARALGVGVVAEGVETEAQAAFFSATHCSELQGYLFCRPQPVEQLRHYLHDTRPEPGDRADTTAGSLALLGSRG
jgi:diguanylate cyclase (GGDEF)-like protein